MRTRTIMVLTLALAACSTPAPPQPLAPPAPVVIAVVPVPAGTEVTEHADGTHKTRFQQRRLAGHYSTLDGQSGFLFDRGATPPTARLDGEGLVELHASNGYGGSTEYQSDDHRVWIRVSGEGQVVLFQGPRQHEGVRVVRDAD